MRKMASETFCVTGITKGGSVAAVGGHIRSDSHRTPLPGGDFQAESRMMKNQPGKEKEGGCFRPRGQGEAWGLAGAQCNWRSQKPTWPEQTGRQGRRVRQE